MSRPKTEFEKGPFETAHHQLWRESLETNILLGENEKSFNFSFSFILGISFFNLWSNILHHTCKLSHLWLPVCTRSLYNYKWVWHFYLCRIVDPNLAPIGTTVPAKEVSKMLLPFYRLTRLIAEQACRGAGISSGSVLITAKPFLPQKPCCPSTGSQPMAEQTCSRLGLGDGSGMGWVD